MTTQTVINQVRKEAAYWAVQLMDSEITAAQREDFQRWLMANELHQKEFRAHTAILNLSRDLSVETRDELLKLAMESTQQAGRRRKAWVAGLAASLLLALGVSWFAYRFEAPSTHLTATSLARDVTLPDGSIAHLNTRTDLRWIGHADERRIELLAGEVLFEVRHDPAKPFTVVLDASEVRVLGTRFNVRRRQSAEVVVTVLEGTVAVSQEQRAAGGVQPPWTRTLHANEQLVYSVIGLVRDVHPATGANAARWREGILEFEDESLSNIVEDLSRYTDRHILVRDPRLAQLRLGGQLNVRGNIKDSLGLLEKLAPVAAHESGNTFVLDYHPDPTEERR